MTEALVQTITAAKFQVTKFREGYDMIEVDDFLDEIIAALRSGPGSRLSKLPDQILTKKFQVTKWREGYDMVEVDDFLDIALEQVRQFLTTADASADAYEGTGVYASVPTPVRPNTLTDSFVVNAKFSQGGFRSYSQQDVHALIDQIRRAIAAGDPRAIADLRNTATKAQLTKVGGGTGYRVKEVDTFLAEVRRRAAGN